jgi:hypothetical protein
MNARGTKSASIATPPGGVVSFPTHSFGSPSAKDPGISRSLSFSRRSAPLWRVNFCDLIHNEARRRRGHCKCLISLLPQMAH